MKVGVSRTDKERYSSPPPPSPSSPSCAFLLQFSPRRVKRSPSRCGQVTLLAERRLRQIEEVNDDTHLAGTLMCGGCPRSAGAFGTRTFHTVRNVCLKCAPATKPLLWSPRASERTVQTQGHWSRQLDDVYCQGQKMGEGEIFGCCGHLTQHS